MHGMFDKLQSAKRPGLSSRWQQNPVGGTWQFVLPTLLPSASHLIWLAASHVTTTFSRHSRELVLFVLSSAWAASGESFHRFKKQEQLFWFASCLKKSYKVVITCQSSVPWTQAEWLGMDGGRVDPSPQRFAWDFVCLNPSKTGWLGKSCLVATRLGTKSMWSSKNREMQWAC